MYQGASPCSSSCLPWLGTTASQAQGPPQIEYLLVQSKFNVAAYEPVFTFFLKIYYAMILIKGCKCL